MKFRAGAFFPFFRQPVSSISNTSIAAIRVFPMADDVAPRIFEDGTPAAMVATAAKFLMAHLPPVDPQVTFISRVVKAIVDDREVTRVQQLLKRFAKSPSVPLANGYSSVVSALLPAGSSSGIGLMKRSTI